MTSSGPSAATSSPPDGGIDRKKLASRVFADPVSLKKLNALVWPRIAESIRERIAAMRAGGTTHAIVVEAAVLIEAGWQSLGR